MDAPFLSLVSNPVATASATAPAPAAADGQGVSGADFAQLLSQMMASAQRQGLAAGTSASLQAVALSPNIEVITADAPLPDNDSLLAFARSQGLDDGMIGALFVPAAGVVVDVGAPLSHAIIVSRELGIPCVISATGGTRRIPDGARIRVDGSTGVVTVLESP